MKKFSVSIALALILSLILSAFSNAAEVKRMTDKLIRLHVIANSDSEYDQSVKLKVRDEVLKTVSEITSGAACKSEAEKMLLNSMDKIEKTVADALDGTGLCAALSYESTEIDRREYDGFTLPAGIYDALCIRIGMAKGKNWWCVLYPSLCLSCAVSVDDCNVFSENELVIIKQPEKVRFKLRCFEIFSKIKSLFSGYPKLKEKSGVSDLRA